METLDLAAWLTIDYAAISKSANPSIMIVGDPGLVSMMERRIMSVSSQHKVCVCTITRGGENRLMVAYEGPSESNIQQDLINLVLPLVIRDYDGDVASCSGPVRNSKPYFRRKERY